MIILSPPPGRKNAFRVNLIYKKLLHCPNYYASNTDRCKPGRRLQLIDSEAAIHDFLQIWGIAWHQTRFSLKVCHKPTTKLLRELPFKLLFSGNGKCLYPSWQTPSAQLASLLSCGANCFSLTGNSSLFGSFLWRVFLAWQQLYAFQSWRKSSSILQLHDEVLRGSEFSAMLSHPHSQGIGQWVEENVILAGYRGTIFPV